MILTDPADWSPSQGWLKWNSDEVAVVVNKVNSLWEAQDGRGVDQNKLTETIQKLSKLSVNSFADDVTKEDAALLGMEPQIMLLTPKGEISLTIGKLNEGSQFFVMDQDGLRYKISKYNMNFLTDLGDLSGLFFEPVDEAQHEVSENIENDLPTDIEEE